jgi:hypothetical protein
MNKKQIKKMLSRHYTYSMYEKPVEIIDFILALNKEVEALNKKVAALEHMKAL